MIMKSKKVVFIMGVSGVGKSTIGNLLSEKLAIPFFDGDDFHPRSNILKMSNKQPLTDEDRKPWLETLNALAKEQLETGSCIIGCSALKQAYRDLLGKEIEEYCIWVHLQGTFEQIMGRLEGRAGHFMPAELLKSQFDTLQHSTESLDIDIKFTPEAIVEEIIEDLQTR